MIDIQIKTSRFAFLLLFQLLIKPVKYRLILGQLKPNQSASLKVLASIILYIGRRVVGGKSQMLVCFAKILQWNIPKSFFIDCPS